MLKKKDELFITVLRSKMMNYKEWIEYEIAELEHKINIIKDMKIKHMQIQILCMLKEKKGER